MKNLLNPTPGQIVYRNRLWANALKENKRKATGTMISKSGGRCCLAVAEDVAISCGVEVIRAGREFSDNEKSHPDDETALFFGWPVKNPRLNYKTNSIEASNLNDGFAGGNVRDGGLSHKEIAQCVIDTFVSPKTKKK